MKQDILNLNNENVGSIELNDAIFGLEVRVDEFFSDKKYNSQTR